MKTKIVTFRICSIIFLIALLNNSCQQEELVEDDISTHTLLAFTLHSFEDDFIRKNLKVDWRDYISEEVENGETREYATEVTNGGRLTQGEFVLATKHTILATQIIENGEWTYSLLKYTASDTASLEMVSFLDKRGFSGSIHFYDLKGRNIKIEGYTKGEMVSTFTTKKRDSIPKPSNSAPKDDPCYTDLNCDGNAGGMGGSSGGSWQMVPIFQYTDWYNVRSDGTWDYNGTTPNGIRYDRVWVSSGYTGGGNYHSHVTGGRGPNAPAYNHRDEKIWNDNMIVTINALDELAPDFPVNDLKKFLTCYKSNQPATITIYADQPNKGRTDLFGADGVGHAFISISQNGRTSTFGFYPKKGGIKAGRGPSIIGNNGGDSYDVSISKTVDGPTLANVIYAATQFPPNYSVTGYNCTDYVIRLGNIAGMNIPSAEITYAYQETNPPHLEEIKADAPGKLGENLRDMDGNSGVKVNKNGGNAPSKANECN